MGIRRQPHIRWKAKSIQLWDGLFSDLRAKLEKLLSFGHISPLTVSEEDMQFLKEACQLSVTILSIRIRDLRQMKVKNGMFLQKLLSKVEGDWRSSTYSMVISSLRTRIYLIENCIDDILQCNDSLCKYAAIMNKVPHLTSDSPNINLQRQGNLICLASPVIAEEPHLTKQRTAAWKQIREESLVTGSTIKKQSDSKGLKSKKLYFGERFGEKIWRTTEKIRLWYRKRSKCGGNVCFYIFAGFCSSWCFYEEGCYPEKRKEEILLTVSPDGSVRNSESDVMCGIEIKCPFPGKVYTEPVQYVIPHYYVCQILSEIHCLQVDNLYFLSYSKESMAI